MKGFHKALNLLYEIYSPAGHHVSLASERKGSPGPITLCTATKGPRGSFVPPALRTLESHCVSSRGASTSAGAGVNSGWHARVLEMPV